jgi:[acyl-carrier-protein] S-malonyltransferase
LSGQLVISGSKENIDKALMMAKSKGALRALPLQVSGAFHSPLMKPAADGLAKAIGQITFKDPIIPLLPTPQVSLLLLLLQSKKN